MVTLAQLTQIVIAGSIVMVWVFRFDNIVKEFEHYGLSSLTRSMVGTSKIVLATLLVLGIWYPSLVLVPSLLMALLMICAQYFHFKIKNPWHKHLPSLVLLLLCLYLVSQYMPA